MAGQPPAPSRTPREDGDGSRSCKINSSAVSLTWPLDKAGGDGNAAGAPLPRPLLPRPPRRPRPRPAPPPWALGSSLTAAALWREEDLVASAGGRPRPRTLGMVVDGERRRREDTKGCHSFSSRSPFYSQAGRAGGWLYTFSEGPFRVRLIKAIGNERGRRPPSPRQSKAHGYLPWHAFPYPARPPPTPRHACGVRGEKGGRSRRRETAVTIP